MRRVPSGRRGYECWCALLPRNCARQRSASVGSQLEAETLMAANLRVRGPWARDQARLRLDKWPAARRPGGNPRERATVDEGVSAGVIVPRHVPLGRLSGCGRMRAPASWLSLRSRPPAWALGAGATGCRLRGCESRRGQSRYRTDQAYVPSSGVGALHDGWWRLPAGPELGPAAARARWPS